MHSSHIHLIFCTFSSFFSSLFSFPLTVSHIRDDFELYRRKTNDGWKRSKKKHSDLMYDITYINISSLLIWIIFISRDLWLCNLRAKRTVLLFFSRLTLSRSVSRLVCGECYALFNRKRSYSRLRTAMHTITSHGKEYNINANNKHYNTKCAQFGCFQNDTNHTRYKICLSFFVRSIHRPFLIFAVQMREIERERERDGEWEEWELCSYLNEWRNMMERRNGIKNQRSNDKVTGSRTA